MNMALVDWAIVGGVFLVMVVGVVLSRRQMKSVSDFLAAGRTARRYLLSVAGGIAGLGAISIVRDIEMNYQAGFSMSWWGLTMSVVVLVVAVSGWVIYRFRQTRCLTLAEFFERRYSRRFRVFAGLVVFGAGIVNFGIFPSVGARLFIHYCGIPEEFMILGMTISTFPLTMIVMLSISLLFVFAGGQIAVILTDFIQGLFVNVVFVVLTLYLLAMIGWDPLFEALAQAPANASLVNPFDTGNIPDFNFWFFLIGVIGFLYSTMSWQGLQAYNVSAKSAHEAKMGGVLGMWRGFPQGLFILLVPMLIYTVMHHADFADTAASVTGQLNGIGTDLQAREQGVLHGQLRGSLVLARLLPVGLLGAFAAVMFAAFVSTHDSYMHSWASVFVQDVVMPFRKTPLSPKRHILVLRLAIVGVALFIFGYSLIFNLSEEIALYFALTGAIFAGGSGAVIIGGLYTRWGTTRGAWGALITGASLAVGHILVHKYVSESSMPETAGGNPFEAAFWWFYSLNGQECWALTMGAAVTVYVTLSLAWGRRRFDLDRLLRRGAHAVAGETVVVDEAPTKGWRMLGMGREFTRGDKVLYIATYVWVGAWFLVFVVGTIANLTHEGLVDDMGWMTYWKVFIYIQVALSVIVIVWFTIGGWLDVRSMFRGLKARKRDAEDDGFVRREEE
jgi:SSS family solute:Na+ symporter